MTDEPMGHWRPARPADEPADEPAELEAEWYLGLYYAGDLDICAEWSATDEPRRVYIVEADDDYFGGTSWNLAKRDETSRTGWRYDQARVYSSRENAETACANLRLVVVGIQTRDEHEAERATDSSRDRLSVLGWPTD